VPNLDPRPRDGYHDPTAGIGGAAPARSALTLRFLLATFGAVVCVVGAILFVTIADAPVLTVIFAVFAVVALVDASIVVWRKRRGEPG
jgi:hypothetical protein